MSTDWRAKYDEVADMLAETRAELDDFHTASKELETELENELQRTEKSQQGLQVKVARAETERDEWKTKFVSLQTTHNTTTTSLHRELDTLRQEHQKAKIQLRELEMGNDDLERNERAVTSSLADIEAKYSRALEEKILLEHELLDKASLEEEMQRFKDELRDANVEISILRDQLSTAQASLQARSDSRSSTVPSSRFPQTPSDEEDLLGTSAPSDLQLSDLSPSTDSLESTTSTPKAAGHRFGGKSVLLQRAGFQRNSNKASVTTPPQNTGAGVIRSNTLPSLFNHSSRTPLAPSPIVRHASNVSTTSTSTTTSKNKGVQMVSEMRARVRNLEQKIHTRVPRLRMGSITGKSSPNVFALSTVAASPSLTSNKIGPAKSSVLDRQSVESKRSLAQEENPKKAGGDSSGWVLIMEDSPSPVKDKEKGMRERRRASSPSAPSSSKSTTLPTLNSKHNTLSQSTLPTNVRRPASRLSATSQNTTASSASRPSTPTLLPVPVSASMTGFKRSAVPGGPSPYTSSSSSISAKRSSLGASTAKTKPSTSHTERPLTISPPSKALPYLPSSSPYYSNVTMRASSKLPSSASSFSQSRIGRPSGRRSAGPDLEQSSSALDSGFASRLRSGSTAGRSADE